MKRIVDLKNILWSNDVGYYDTFFIDDFFWIEYFLMLLSNFDELLGVIEKKLYIIIVLKYLRNLKNLNEFKTFIQINNKNNY